MTTKLLIDRELLERVIGEGSGASLNAMRELRAILAAPRQPDGEAISRERVQAEADAFFDWPTTDKSSVTTTSCLIFARCIAGMVAAELNGLREDAERYRYLRNTAKWPEAVDYAVEDGSPGQMDAAIDAALAEVNI